MDEPSSSRKVLDPVGRSLRKAPEHLKSVFQSFFQSEASGSIILLICTLVALFLANSSLSESYFKLLHIHFTISVGEYTLDLSAHQFVNDGLMALFFLVVGLEIKREIAVGELSTPKKAALPVTAALGGMLAPALIYTLFNYGGPGAAGWGIPMATDIAFALGILALLGSRVPTSLKLFLTALAIADDLGAVLVIAIFYTEQIIWADLLIMALLLLLIWRIGHAGVRRLEIYVVLAAAVWVAAFLSGLHATVAGVLLALTIPVRARIEPEEFLEISRSRLDVLDSTELTRESMIHDREQLEVIYELYYAARRIRPVGLALEEYFHPLVAFVILPVFALFNAGVVFPKDLWGALTQPISLGILAGLVIGKQIGVTMAAWLAVRSGLAELPGDLSWKHIYGGSWLAGVGFTMSLFVTDLAFKSALQADVAKLAILVASLVAGSGGYLLLRFWLQGETTPEPADFR